jgi:DNA-binding beta-propeller fold protein YncE
MSSRLPATSCNFTHALLVLALCGCGDDVRRAARDSGSERDDDEPGDAPRDVAEGRLVDGDDRDLTLVDIEPIGAYEAGVFDGGAAEITAFDPASARLFFINGDIADVDVLDLSDPTHPRLIDGFDVTTYGGAPTSIDVRDGLVAVAVPATVPQALGRVVFFDAGDLSYVNDLQVGALPDMLSFSPDGNKLVIACEGEPDSGYLDDPEGSVAIIDTSGDVARLTDADVKIATFGAFTRGNIDPQIRIYGPGSSVAEDLEPEYVAISADSMTAWVGLQENNAMAIVDLASATVTQLVALGFKNHSRPGNALDPSDVNARIAIENWPVFGMYQPDALARFTVNGQDYVLSANEGAVREYDAITEKVRVKDLELDPQAFPDAERLQQDEQLGRLIVSRLDGDLGNDGDHEQLFVPGGRSVAVWSAAGRLLWDSGDELEQTIAAARPNDFNANKDGKGVLDSRSDNSGPEPEGAVVAELWGKPYAFVGLERVGGVFVYDMSDPHEPSLVLFDNSTRDFPGDAELGVVGDLGPEGLEIVHADDSPIGEPLLIVANEVSSSVRIYRIVAQ